MRENKNSKLLSALLAILMIFSMLPVTTFAEEEIILQEDPNQIVEENQVEEIPEEEILNEVEEAPEEQIEEIIEVVESPQPVVENLEEFNPPEEVEETIEEIPDIEEVEQINSLEEPVEEVKEEIQVEETGISNEVPVVKEVKHDSVTILSVNENNEELIGTEFAVYSDIENLETSIIKTISAATFTLSTIDEGLKDFLPVEGNTTLYLKETKVPEGYIADTEIYKITIHIEVDEENNTIVYGLAFDDGQKELKINHEPVIKTIVEEIEVVEEGVVLGATAFRTLPYNLNPEEGKILIPFRKDWSGSGDTEATRPSSITISLYKYLGASFDATTATLVDTKLVTAAEGWACEFDISKEELYSGSVYNSDSAYKWAVVESEVIGYKETGHVNPSVEFNPPEVAGGGWDRTTPCSEISITSSGHDKSVVCAKKGSTYIIWSVDPLSSAERELIFKSAAAGINGFGSGKIANCTFISGFGSSSEFGMTITENSIQFNDTSNWSFYAVGIYNKSSTFTNASSITNTYLPKATTVTLPVTKTIEGTPHSSANFDFVLTTLTENAPMPFSGGEKLTITGEGTGNFGTITYTMPGTWKYSVYEKAGGLKAYGYDDNIYKVTVTVNDVGGELVALVAIEDRSGASVDKMEFNNLYLTGDLIVQKIIAGNAASINKEYNFKVTLFDTSINGLYGDMTFVNGVAEFTLKGGERVFAKNLPAGVKYTVTEDDYSGEGYVTTKTNDTGVITYNNEIQATFTNTRNADGSLTILKKLAGNAQEADKLFTFRVDLQDVTITGTYGDVEFDRGIATIQLKGGESKTIEGLPVGTIYKVEEDNYTSDGYETTSINEEGTINEHSPAIAEFTNTRNTYGDLIVHKRLAGNAANRDQRFLFTVTLSDTTISDKFGDMIFENGVAKFELSGGESKKAEDLPNGITYKVVEDDYSSLGYVTTKTHDTGTITGNEEVEAIFTNTRDTYGSLEVSKVLTGNDVDTNKEFNFTIKLTGETINGTYSGVTFTNNTATIKLKGGEYKVIEGLPNGIRYDVSEDNYYADGYFTSKTGATGTIVENEKMIAEFVNSRNTYGSLIVEKKLEGNAAHVNKSFSFTVTLSDTNITAKYGDMVFENGIAKFELKGGEKLQATGLPNGLTYTVSEKDYTDEGYITTKYNDTGTIVGNEEITVTFVNERNATGSLIISKKLDGNDPNPEDKFKFTIELTGKPVNGNYSGVIFTDNKATLELKGGESKQIDGLPNGITYTVLEDSYREQGYFTMTTDSFTGQIDENKPAEVVYINIRDTFGDLTVKKVLAGNATDANKAFNFTVILSDTSITDGYGSMKFIEGKATFTLKGGEEIKATGLPNGVTYTVIEDDYSAQGYKTTKTNDTGKIVGNSEKVVTFTNTRNVTPEPPKPQQDDKPLPQYGSLIITKRVTGDLAEYDKYFSFKVTFNVDGSYYYDGVRTGNLKSGDVIQLKHDESITIYGLPDGTKYTVTEIGNNGYRVYASGNSGTISAINIATASFTNVRSKAPITGDITNLPLWLGSSILSGLGLLFIVFYRRRRNK